MQVILQSDAIAEELAACEVGDRKVIHFTVTGKTPDAVTGEATAAYYEEDTEEPAPAPKAYPGPINPRGAKVAAPVRAMSR